MSIKKAISKKYQNKKTEGIFDVFIRLEEENTETKRRIRSKKGK